MVVQVDLGTSQSLELARVLNSLAEYLRLGQTRLASVPRRAVPYAVHQLRRQAMTETRASEVGEKHYRRHCLS